ncbi:protein Fe65 homolog [Bemisia tabaci]|uniref:protein Fe65 homolog n=1 Tax=Bemisia tabaci TaxID=7038 RepID=UPI0008F9C769|nr:PREDICTED: protein Fe65 homolog isoform X2 [Bemisia tabaci]
MLCGELVRPNLLPGLHPVSDTRSPYATLLGMAAIAASQQVEEDDVFLENGLLSYENPNYHLDPARLADALNSNTELPETGSTGSARSTPSLAPATAARRNYAALDINGMGVDVTTGPHPATIDNHRYRNGIPDNVNVNRGLDLTTALRHTKPDLIDSTTQNWNGMKDNMFEKHQPPTTLLLNSTDSPRKIPHVIGQLNSDIYAVPVKRRSPSSPKKLSPPSSPCQDENLPAGWEKHEDNDGAYYWHIKSGTIQREPPESAMNEPKTPLVKDAETALTSFQQTGGISLVTRSNTSSALEDLDGKKKEDLAFKRRSYPARAEPEGKEKVIRFAVRSLGWVEIAEEDLTPERSSKAVNKCIVDLSLGRNDLIDNVGRWGDGKDLFMDLDEGALKLIDPENLTALNAQPIHTIRVWGVGRDNGRDFAYVARDRMTRKHMCHVFRCDIAARTIANTLRDICKRIMIERSLQQNLAKPIDLNGCRTGATRPTNLPTENRKSHHRNSAAPVTHCFPTPMEEPRKVLPAKYLGSMQVDKASGMDALNTAIDTLTLNTPKSEWSDVSVAVAPSMITISHTGDEKQVAECRVRYLSFLGIGKNVQQCAFIMHTAQDLFIAHVFHCEPSSGALCKTIEAACKLRYQKCLDAHPQGLAAPLSNSSPSKGIGATIKNFVGSITGRKQRANSVES